MNHKNNKIIFTTSWDDGHQCDLRLAKLLDKYGIRGTFYIPKIFENRISDEDIINISKNHEIGAHTINHVFLSEVSIDKAKREIIDSKKWLDELIGKPTKMFAYPKGQFNLEIRNLVKEAGFLGARTVSSKDFNSDNWLMPVDFQVYPFPFRRRSDNSLHLSRFLLEPFMLNIANTYKYKIGPISWLSWSYYAKNFFDKKTSSVSCFHLWGHSWEIDKYNLWSQLEDLFKYLSKQKEVLFLTNYEVIKYYENINS